MAEAVNRLRDTGRVAAVGFPCSWHPGPAGSADAARVAGLLMSGA